MFALEEKRKKKEKVECRAFMIARGDFANTQIISCFPSPLLWLAGSAQEEIRAIQGWWGGEKKGANIFSD